MKIQTIQAIKHNSDTINEPTIKPEYLKDVFIPILSIQKTSPTKNDLILKVFLSNQEAFVLKEDFMKFFDC